jgi:hypothetical protein
MEYMAGAEGDRIRLEGEATSVIGAVVDFYERHLRDRDGAAVEELREMKRGVMGQHNTFQVWRARQIACGSTPRARLD